MTSDEPERPGQVMLDDAICEAIQRACREWGLTSYDVVGVLTVIATRVAHEVVEHYDDD